MPDKFIALNESIYHYLIECRSNAADPILSALRRETEALGDISRMLISREQETFLGLLAAAIGARTAIEVGTFTGSSSICVARSLPAGGRLICIDASKEWTDIARKYWKQAGVEDRIDLRLGQAIPLLQQLEPELKFDLAFIDADKREYDAYYESILPRLRPNGLILFDNMLWGGRLGAGPVEDEDGRAIDALNRKLAGDARIECVLLPIADGIQMCRKRKGTEAVG